MNFFWANPTLQDRKNVGPIVALLACAMGTSAAIAEPAGSQAATAHAAQQALLTVKSFELEGVSLDDAAQALQTVGAIPGSYTLQELRSLASGLTRYWRNKGFLGARVELPAQDITSGNVRYGLVKGRIGALTLEFDNTPAGTLALEAVRRRLCGSMTCTDVPLYEPALQHAMGAASEIVNANVTARLQPGRETGTSDVLLRVEARPALSVQGVVDNHGSEATGESRATVMMQARNLFVEGGDTHWMTRATNRGGNTAHVIAHSQPLGLSDWRAGVQAFDGNVRLGGQFTVLEANANANGLGVYAQQLLRRTPDSEATLRFTVEQARVESSALGLASQKKYESGQILVRGSVDDRHLILPATSRWELGMVHSRAGGSTLMGTQGSAEFLTWRVQRFQWLPLGMRLDVSLRGQQSNANLDAYNKIAIAGPEGVRAYRIGEAFGDSGWISRVDLAKHWQPASDIGLTSLSTGVFYDAGKVRLAHQPAAGATQNSLSRQGYGVHAQAQYRKHLSVRMFWAHVDGPVSVEDQKKSRVGAELFASF